MLESLIDKLDKIKCKLMKIKNEEILADCFLPQEHCRSLTTMVNIFSSLVIKTVQNENYEADIGLCYDEDANTDEEPLSTNFCSSEKFLQSVKTLLNSSSAVCNGGIHTYLLNFMKLLGDLAISICKINKCKMKQALGIKVKDLIMMKNSYTTFWELLSSLFYPKTFNNSDVRTVQGKHSSEINIVVADIVQLVESCLKEMYKVKLEIEHYLKVNLIEMEFKKSEDSDELGNDVTGDKTETNQTSKLFKTQDSVTNIQNLNEYFPHEFEEHRDKHQSTLPQTKTEFQDSYLASDFNYYNYELIDSAFSSFYKTPIIYPSDVLFFKPPTVILNSQLEPTRKNSLLKIYSVDSILDNASTMNENNGSLNGKRQIESVEVNTKNKDSFMNKPLFDQDEDLFSNMESTSEAEYVQLKEKISSLFSMIRTNQLSDEDDIFNTNKPTSKIENTDSPCYQKPTEEKPEIKAKKYFKKQLNINKTSHLNSKIKEKQKPIVCKSTGKKSKQEDQNMQYPLYFFPPTRNTDIYNSKSIIELFKSNATKCFNEEMDSTQGSIFGLWPVAAKYVYVSREENAKSRHSVSSGNSVSFGKNVEKSFFSLQMNKKYENNHIYDEDLIVLNQMDTLGRKRSSTNSLDNQNIVYIDHEKAKFNYVKDSTSPNCAEKLHIKKNQWASFNDSLDSPQHGALYTQQQTYAVHYANCMDSYVINNNCKKKKIDFFNFNSYDDSQNWNSFISIVTSNVGPTAHINQQKMFRKIMTNFGAESLGNIYTLPNSGCRFRLFDVNGYPLTDSDGNVLRDPYGKSVVHLDPMGVPRGNTNVFDAAGNSQKDVNFDPTQKPQTNCINVKLTDNFKRPLHLFDKYGRPLTDSTGKLLVNIHGRPLLRFDNFGRPNTDYRGGPLYTDNGFRWSYKKESFAKEHISNETLASQKLQNEFTKTTTDDTDEKPMICQDNSSPYHKNIIDFENVDSKNSDIWLKVECVLQQHTKKTKIETRPSQTNLIVNNVTVKRNQEVKDNLSSIIYHDGVKKCTYKYGRDELKEKENNTEPVVQEVIGECRLSLEDKTSYRASKNGSNTIKSEGVFPPFYNNIIVQNTDSKRFTPTMLPQKNPEYYMPNIVIEKNNIFKDPRILVYEDFLKKYRFMDILMHRPSGVTKNVAESRPPIVTIQNQEYLNNLCNQILKNKVESGSTKWKSMNAKIPVLNSLLTGKKDNHKDTTFLLTDFTSSITSKYSNEVPLYTDSPEVSVEPCKTDPQIGKILADIDSKFKTNQILRNGRKYGERRNLGQLDFPNTLILKDKDKVTVQREGKHKAQGYKELSKGYFKSSDTSSKTNGHFKSSGMSVEINGNFKSSGTSKETNMYSDFVNNGIHQCQINVQERVRSGFQYCQDDPCIEGVRNYMYYDGKETNTIKHNNNIPENQLISHPVTYTTEVYHGEYCRHFKNEKDKIKHSLFRFPSDDQMGTTLALNHKDDYVNEKQWFEQNLNQINQRYENRAKNEFLTDRKCHKNTNENFSPTLVKKSQKNNRDCNLVSFLGTPVKYFLNKIDTKLSLRQQEKAKKQFRTIYKPYEMEKKVKTLFDNTKGNKKQQALTDTQGSKSSQKNCEKREKPLAYKSKSFSQILDSKNATMTYSGSQDTSVKYSPYSSSRYNKCSSDTEVMANYKHAHSQRRKRRYEIRKPKNEQYSFETHYTHPSGTANPHHYGKSEKSPKRYSKQTSTSTSAKNKIKPGKQFKKSGHSSKQKRPRK